MDKLELFSEPFAPTGNMAAKGFKNLLGRPALGLLPTVLREAIQNSVDAAKGGTPEILIRVRSFNKNQVDFLRSHVFTAPLSPPESLQELHKILIKEQIRVLEICDFRTSGLGGPTRADLVNDKEEPDFVNFMRNVGTQRSAYQTGGTYGYGKTSLYAMSSCATILVDTATTLYGEPVRRLMGAHLGDMFVKHVDPSSQGRKYTGRHWWGVLDGENTVDPLEGIAANAMSMSLGLPERTETDTGTSIVIIDPQFDEEETSTLADALIESILWNFWPRMTKSTPEDRRLSITLEVDGKSIPIPAPEHFPPLDLFSQALADIRQENENTELILCKRPKENLGRISIRRGLKALRVGPAAHNDSPFNPPSARIALMRPIDLVVRYIEGIPFPDPAYEWAGVFRCSDNQQVEAAFAQAEPPAHEDWIPDNLPKGAMKTWVNVALREIRSKANNYVSPKLQIDSTSQTEKPLAHVASKLGSFLGGVSSRGPGKPSSPTSINIRRSKKEILVSNPTFHRLEEEGGYIQSIFTADLHNSTLKTGITLCAQPYLFVDGAFTGFEDLPADLTPKVTWIRHKETNQKKQGNHFPVDRLSGKLEIAIRMPPDAAVTLKLWIDEKEQ